MKLFNIILDHCVCCRLETYRDERHTCNKCNVAKTDNYTIYEMYINGTFYCIQYRNNEAFLRIEYEPLIKLSNDININEDNFKDFILSDKIKTYKLFL